MNIKGTSLFLAVSLGLSTGVVVTGITGCAGDRYNRSTGEHIDDESVRMRVNSALHDNADYKFTGVNVTVFKGTVQLSGFVDIAAQKSEAADIARQVVGVKDIANGITVKDRNESSNGAYVDDKALTRLVRSALSDNPDYKFTEVNVDASRGTVQLSGFVDTSDQKSKAADIAKQVQGVQDVENNITVKP
jgi:hyperosmotically inducible periplasmic protein